MFLYMKCEFCVWNFSKYLNWWLFALKKYPFSLIKIILILFCSTDIHISLHCLKVLPFTELKCFNDWKWQGKKRAFSIIKLYKASNYTKHEKDKFLVCLLGSTKTRTWCPVHMQNSSIRCDIKFQNTFIIYYFF